MILLQKKNTLSDESEVFDLYLRNYPDQETFIEICCESRLQSEKLAFDLKRLIEKNSIESVSLYLCE